MSGICTEAQENERARESGVDLLNDIWLNFAKVKVYVSRERERFSNVLGYG